MVFFNLFMVNFFDFIVVTRQATLKISDDLPDNFFVRYGMRISLEDLYTMLIPMYVWLPQVGEPWVSVWVPYWIGILRIKCDTRITPAHADKLLQAPDMDVVNTPYNDLICVTSSFTLVFFAPANLHIRLFAWLVFFAFFSYIQARKRLLSWQTAIAIGDRSLHDAASYLWALPLSMLAANVGSNLEGDDEVFVGYAGLFGIGHFVLHALFVKFVVPLSDLHDDVPQQTYSEALKKCQGATYRNTNPVETLKSIRKPWEGVLTFYCRGKEYLQVEFDRYYENAEGRVYSLRDLKQDYFPCCLPKNHDKE